MSEEKEMIKRGKKKKLLKVEAWAIIWPDGTVQAHQDKDIAAGFLKRVSYWASIEKSSLVPCVISYRKERPCRG